MWIFTHQFRSSMRASSAWSLLSWADSDSSTKTAHFWQIRPCSGSLQTASSSNELLWKYSWDPLLSCSLMPRRGMCWQHRWKLVRSLWKLKFWWFKTTISCIFCSRAHSRSARKHTVLFSLGGWSLDREKCQFFFRFRYINAVNCILSEKLITRPARQ